MEVKYESQRLSPKDRWAYTADRIRSGLHHIRLIFVVFIFLYGFFAILDYLLVGDYFQTFLVIRFGIVIPLMVVSVLLSFLPSFYKFAQPLMVLCFVTGGTGIAYMLILCPENFSYYGGIFMVLFAGYFLIRLDTPHALFGGLFTLLFYTIGYAYHYGTLNMETLMVVFFFFGANIIGALGNYQMEKMGRANFLHKREIQRQNEQLHDRVQEQKTELLQVEKAIDSASDAVVIFNPQGVATYCNAAYELLMRPFSLPNTSVPHFFEDIFAGVLTGESWKGERTVVDDTGIKKVLLIQMDAVHQEIGVIAGIVTTCRDITEREIAREMLKASEETFRNIVKASPMGIHLYRLDDNQRLIFVGTNPAADRLLKVDNRRFIGKTFEEAFPSLSGTETFLRYRRAALLGENWQNEHIVYTDDKITGAFEVHVFQISPGNIAVLFNDITGRKQAEEERQQLQMQLVQSQKMESVGRLAGGVAHDFNNMLGVILGHTEMALKGLDSSHLLYQSMKDIRKAADRSADLTRQLLAFARKQAVMPKVLSLNETVEGMLDMLQRLIGENINLNWIPEPGIGNVRIDPSQIDQILANLCINARDAIADTGSVTIKTGNIIIDETTAADKMERPPGRYIMLAISDSGRGMDTETLSNVFEPFFTTKGLGKGTGLGLATVYGIVKQNEGFIDLKSEVGKGTTFTIFLPRCDVEMERPTEHQAVTSLRGTETILLVEDEAMILELTTKLLEKLGYQVFAYNSPQAAISFAKGYRDEIHLLLTDVIMPEMNGRDVVNHVLQYFPNLKCLFMSGYTADVIAHHGVLEEDISFIQKPFTSSDLSLKIRDALGHGSG